MYDLGSNIAILEAKMFSPQKDNNPFQLLLGVIEQHALK